MTAPNRAARLTKTAGRLAAWLFPRRCPLCGELLGTVGPICAACAPEEKRLAHTPARLPATEHTLDGLSGAAAPFYYEDGVRRAILQCKMYGRPWYAWELADQMALVLFAAQKPRTQGDWPVYENASGIQPYHLIVPVPARHARQSGPRLPALLARRLGLILEIPVQEALVPARELREQKTLNREERLRNAKDGYKARPGIDLTGKRVLLVDDVITTGATVSACAIALLRAGAFEVFAVCVAADEELPKAKQKKQPRRDGAQPSRRENTKHEAI